MIENSLWTLVFIVSASCVNKVHSGDSDYNIVHTDGSYQFGGDSPDSYHYAVGNRNNVVKGEFGGRNPKTGEIDRTIYTAGPRGFRPRGKNIVRNYDLGQSGPRPVGSPDDPYYDPYEDPSYRFGFKTRTHTREEEANRSGDVTGRYSYVDDVGERHNVEYIAGRRTGFHVKTPFPDSNPRALGPLYFRGRGRPIPRGRTSIQRGLDGSYRFVSAGPDQRRTEVSDATGHVRGSYTYLDEKGVQHSVHYIAGPETGYRVLKNVKGPHLPTIFPFGDPNIISPEFYDDYNKDIGDVGDIFEGGGGGSSGGGGTKPFGGGARPGGGGGSSPGGSFGSGIDVDKDDYDKFGGTAGGAGRPSRPRPSNAGDTSYDDDYDLFGDSPKRKPGSPTSTSRPSTAGDFTGYPSSTTPGPIDYGGSSTTPGYGGGSSSPGYGGSTSPGYDGGLVTPGYGDLPTPGYGSVTPIPGYPGNVGGGGYPGDTGRPQKPLDQYGPPGFGKPGGNRPGGGTGGAYESNEIDDDFGLFGSASGHGARPVRPPSKPDFPGAGPSVQVGNNGRPGNRPCEKCQGTIVRNVGDRTFTVPPGVSVRAHVQAIDLIPYESKIPAPGAQMRADTLADLKTAELNAEEDTLVDDKTKDDSKADSSSPTTISSLETTESITRSSS